MRSMASRGTDQKIARAIQDFASHDGEDVSYVRALTFVRTMLGERREGEDKSSFAARLWLEHRHIFTGRRA